MLPVLPATSQQPVIRFSPFNVHIVHLDVSACSWCIYFQPVLRWQQPVLHSMHPLLAPNFGHVPSLPDPVLLAQADRRGGGLLSDRTKVEAYQLLDI